ncbi:hypothetical protein [Thioalkalivibrio sp. HK1]|uniref:hypothetical protein n=1 Tax=Thioalkalivibrio sp. HK1 TaxID=1469245 RepID=UPI0004B7F7A8|nr:hypothetical protein [Thioalkalivibrio sp. HK1]
MEIPLWEKLLAGVAALALLFFFVPGLRRWFKNPPKAGKGDWPAAILPILAVAAFVMLMIYMIR